MKVKVLFFAALREQLGTPGEEVELPAGVTTVAGLRSFLLEKGNSWREALSERKLIRMAVNQDMVEAELEELKASIAAAASASASARRPDRPIPAH